MAIKDGITDKLQDFINQLDKEGFSCMIVGAQDQALDQVCCDICRLKYLQQICIQASYDLLRKYQNKQDAKDARHH